MFNRIFLIAPIAIAVSAAFVKHNPAVQSLRILADHEGRFQVEFLPVADALLDDVVVEPVVELVCGPHAGAPVIKPTAAGLLIKLFGLKRSWTIGLGIRTMPCAPWIC